jgi:hypothetical protein
MWLVRVTEDFEHSLVFLKEARNVKFAGVVKPGQVLRIQCDLVKMDQNRASVKAQGFVEDSSVVSGRLILELVNHVDRNPDDESCEFFSRSQARKLFDHLCQMQHPVSS